MSYHHTISRDTNHTLGPITVAELRRKLPSVHGYRSEIERTNSLEFRFSPEDLPDISVYWANGDLWAERANEEHIPFLSAVALALHARLLGDEGEEYKADGRIIPPPRRGKRGLFSWLLGR